MAIEFLSEDWAKAVEQALNASESFRNAAGSLTARIQQVVTSPDGEKKYWFVLEGGRASLGTGELAETVDATITQDYETAVAIMKNELSAVAAYMSNKLRIAGDLMKLMQLQGVLGQMPAILKDLDVDY